MSAWIRTEIQRLQHIC